MCIPVSVCEYVCVCTNYCPSNFHSYFLLQTYILKRSHSVKKSHCYCFSLQMRNTACLVKHSLPRGNDFLFRKTLDCA
uniref:Uncharacterized protein n=1 Tax=Anguilla anguilla TaxID=7936 RepID=A0A0E9WZY7_ANGAN